jgi:hypothetical protein
VAISVGSVEVDVIPSTQGIYQRLRDGLVPAATKAGEDAGSAAGRAFGPAMQTRIADVGLRIGQQIGDQIAARITAALRTSIRDGITQGGRTALPAATRQGDDTGGAFARAMKARLEAAFRTLPKVNIDADTSEADADLQALRARMETLASKRIGIDIDAQVARTEIEDIERELTRLGAAHPNVTVRADTAKARADLLAVREEIDRISARPAHVRVDTDGAFGQKLRAAVAAAQAALPDITIGADTGEAQAEIAALRVRLGTLSEQRIGIDIDAATARQQLTDIQQRLFRLSGQRVQVDVDAGVTRADAVLANFRVRLDELRGRTATVDVRVDAATAEAHLAAVGAMIAALNDEPVRIIPEVSNAAALSALFQLGIALGAVAAIPAFPILAAGAGLFTSAVVAAGVGVGALAAVALPAVAGITGALQAQKAAQDAATNSALKGGQAASQDASQALQAAGAQQALASAERNGALQIAQAGEQVTQAKRAVGDAIQQAALKTQQAERAVQDAERALAQAQKDATKAQLDLTAARKQAALDLEDLNNQLVDSQLSQRDAVIQVQQATTALHATQNNPSATALQREQAQLTYDQAVQHLKEQGIQVQRLKDQTTAANKAGVEGSTTVKSAQDQLAQSQQQVVDRTRALKDAQAEQARTAVANARSIADAQQKVADSERGRGPGSGPGRRLHRLRAAADRLLGALRRRGRGPGCRRAGQISAGPRQADPRGPRHVQRVRIAEGRLQGLVDGASAAGYAAVHAGDPGAEGGTAVSDTVRTGRSVGDQDAAGPSQRRVQVAVVADVQARLGNVGRACPGRPGDRLRARLQGHGGRHRRFPAAPDPVRRPLRDPHRALRELGAPGSRVRRLSSSSSPTRRGRLRCWLARCAISSRPFLRSRRRCRRCLARFCKSWALWPGALASIAQTLPWLIQGLYLVYVATRLWTIAMWLLNAALDADPLVLIILAILALVAAVIYAYNHWTGFRQVVQAAWKGIQKAASQAAAVLHPIFSGIATAAKKVGDGAVYLWQVAIGPTFRAIAKAATSLWQTAIGPAVNGIAEGVRKVGAVAVWLWQTALGPAFRAIAVVATALWQNALQPVVNAISTGFQKVAAGAAWLWNSILSPIFNAISLGARILIAIVLTVLIAPLVIAFHVVGALAGWLWDVAIGPAFRGIAALATWLWQNAIQPAFNGIAIVATWLYQNIIKLYFDLMVAEFRFVADIGMWLWNNALAPAFRGIAAVATWLWQNAIQPAFNGISEVATWLYDHALKPVFDNIKTAVGLVGDAFGLAKDAIKLAWDKLIDITKAPINFVIKWVYTNGIKAVWDKIAGFVGLDKLPDAPQLLASGGTLGNGWGPARPMVTNRPTAIVGEGNPNYPEYVIPTDPRYRDRALALHAAAGTQLMDGGGILGGLKSAWNWTKDTVGDIVGTGIDWAKKGADLIANPSKIWDDLVKPILAKVSDGVGSFPMGKMLASSRSRSSAASKTRSSMRCRRSDRSSAAAPAAVVSAHRPGPV